MRHDLIGKNLREHRAIIQFEGHAQTEPGFRVTVMATDGEEAYLILEEKPGKGTVFDLHNEEDANTIR